MAPLIAMEANHIRYLGGKAIPAKMFGLASLVAAEHNHRTNSVKRLVALATAALALMASRSRINNLGLLAQALEYFCLKQLPLPHRL